MAIGAMASLAAVTGTAVAASTDRVYEDDQLALLNTLTPLVWASEAFRKSRDDFGALKEVIGLVHSNTPVKPRLWSTGASTINIYFTFENTLGMSGDGGETWTCTKSSAGGTCARADCLINPEMYAMFRVQAIHHEFLHALGVGHTSDSQSVMYGGSEFMGRGRMDGRDLEEVVRLYTRTPGGWPQPQPSGDLYPI